jgi:P-type conjugative transfer protein TrbJ
VLIAAAVAAMLCTSTAHAQWVVFDPTNLVQNTLTAIRTLEQINNQIKQLQNEAQMLMNQARNLASLPFSVVNQLRANLATTERLIAQAKGLAYDVTNGSGVRAPVPEQYAATVSGDQMYRDAQERWKNTLNGLQTTMQMQAQVSQNLSEDESVLADLVGKSQSADRRAAGHAGHEPVAGLAGQAVHPDAAAPDHAGPGGLAGAGAAGGGHGARPRGAAALPGRPARRTRRSPWISTATDGRPPCDASSPCRFRCRAAGRLRPAAGRNLADLAADPVRLKALRAQCAADRQAAGEDACRAAAEAFRRRFFAGHTGPDDTDAGRPAADPAELR